MFETTYHFHIFHTTTTHTDAAIFLRKYTFKSKMSICY